MNNTLKENPQLHQLLLILTFAAALLVRVKYLAAGLEYDEIWSLENFANMPAGRLFTELALPNNQPLNSLFIKFAAFLQLPIWGIRLHSLLAGLLTIPLVGFICYVLSGGKKAAALWTMVFAALSAPDATYSVLARGYALQVFFLALFAAGISSCGRWRPKNKFLQYLPETAVLIGGECSILTLPTSVMYLAAITGAAFLIRPGKPGKLLAAVLGGGVIFALAYYLYNFQQLNQARIWGTKIDSIAAYFTFLKSVMSSLITPAGVLMTLFALYCSPGRRVPVLLVFLVPLAAAAVTNAGPARTYLPFCTAVAILAGCGISDLSALLKQNFKIPATFLLGAVLCAEFFWYLPAWRTPDWCDIFKVSAKEPKHVLVVHRATSGYPLAWNNRPQIYSDFVNRLLDQSPHKELLMFDGPGRINGNDSKNNEAVLTVNTRGKRDNICKLKCRRYKLIEINTDPRPGDFVFIALRPVPSAVLRLFFKELSTGNMSLLTLNPWLISPIRRPEGELRYALLAGEIPEGCSVNWELLRGTNGTVSVYKLIQ